MIVTYSSTTSNASCDVNITMSTNENLNNIHHGSDTLCHNFTENTSTNLKLGFDLP